MNKVTLFFMLVMAAQFTMAQENYKDYFDKATYAEAMVKLKRLKDTKKESEITLFLAEFVKQEEYFKEKEIWDNLFYQDSKLLDNQFFAESHFDENAYERLQKRRKKPNIFKELKGDQIVGLIKKYRKGRLNFWYKENAVTGVLAGMFSGMYLVEPQDNISLWQFDEDREAIEKYLNTLLDDKVEILFITENHLMWYYEEMGLGDPPVTNALTFLKKRLANAKNNAEKAVAYRNAARLNYLRFDDLNQALEWAKKAIGLEDTIEINLLLAGIYEGIAIQKKKAQNVVDE